jgi:hypothetical protein
LKVLVVSNKVAADVLRSPGQFTYSFSLHSFSHILYLLQRFSGLVIVHAVDGWQKAIIELQDRPVDYFDAIIANVSPRTSASSSAESSSSADASEEERSFRSNESKSYEDNDGYMLTFKVRNILKLDTTIILFCPTPSMRQRALDLGNSALYFLLFPDHLSDSLWTLTEQALIW